MRVPVRGLGGAALVLVGGSEYVTWRVSRFHPAPRAGPSTAILVLGYPSRRGGKLHPVQRWRTEIGVRTFTRLGNGSLLVFSGTQTRGSTESEAAVMAGYAVSEFGVPAERVVLEERARSTWENVSNSGPLLEDAEQVVIASDPLHAEKARRYLMRQRPDLALRLFRAQDYRVLERWWIKVASVLHNGRGLASGAFDRPPGARPHR